MGLNVPKAFEKRMIQQLGNEYSAFIESQESPASMSIRYNLPKNATPKIENPIPWEPSGTYLSERPVFTLDPTFHGGVYYVQEASSMFTGWIVKRLIANFGAVKILDLCAAPGGKSTHIASIINENSLLVSNEVIGSRAAILSENLVKWGNPNVFISRNDPKDFNKLEHYFDIVVVDAPCSGEGLFRRDNAAMDEWSENNTRLCAQRQQRIISDIWPSLKPGGFLVYSTCTFNPDENENNVKWITEQFKAECLSFEIPENWGISRIETNTIKAYQFWPHRIKGEGFFLSVIKKDGEIESKTLKYKAKKQYQPVPKPLLNELNGYTKPTSDLVKYIHQDSVLAIPHNLDADYRWLNENIYLLDAGVCLAKVYGNKLAPEHSLAMSWTLNKEYFNFIEVDMPTALKFLHRDTIYQEGAQPGFNLITFEGIPLGWIKNIGNRWNNLYPQNWRIRMNLPE